MEETMLRTAGRFVPIVLVLVLAAPLAAYAQRDARITASLSSAFGDGGPAPTVALAAAFPVVSRVRAEIEGTFVRNLDFGQYYSCPPQAICAAVVSFPFTLTGDAASLGGNIVAEVPWRTRRIRPYIVGGGGIAHVRRERLETRFDRTTTLTTLSSTAPLLTAGGGVEFLLGDRLVLAGDARYQRMWEKDQFHRIDIPPNVDLVRVGSTIGYRF
jgi:opacity protein-like surface antigen